VLLRLSTAALAASLAGCASTPVPPYAGEAPRADVVYLIAGGWHTEIGLSHAAAGDLLPAPAATLAAAPYLVFGWGERDYYTDPDPGLGDLLRALVPGPAALLIIPLAVPPPQAYGSENVLVLPVSRPGLVRLVEYLQDHVAKAAEGAPLRIGAGPEPGSAFFASTGDYSIARTCNTWTAEALQVAGLPIDAAGVIFAGQVLDRARPLAVDGAAPSDKTGALSR
jgi:uncharacterized protein (TIGR02117 family)